MVDANGGKIGLLSMSGAFHRNHQCRMLIDREELSYFQVSSVSPSSGSVIQNSVLMFIE